MNVGSGFDSVESAFSIALRPSSPAENPPIRTASPVLPLLLAYAVGFREEYPNL